MRVAVRAPDLGPDPAEGAVLQQHHGVALGRLVEARPAAVGLELRVGGEQPRAAGPAVVDAAGLGVGVLAGERRLGARLPEHLVLLRGQPLAPLVLRELNLRHGWQGTRTARFGWSARALARRW